MNAVKEADGILLGARFQLDKHRIDQLQRCKVIARYGVGVDNVDVKAALQRGITVTMVPDYGTEEVANHAFALLLALHRRLVDYDKAVRDGLVTPTRPVRIPRLSVCTLGVIGFGRIGQAVVRRAKSFELEVLVSDPVAADDAIQHAGALPCALDDLLVNCDFLSLHVPLDAATRHLLNAASLARMKPGAIVINVARGGLIDEQALAEAIEAGTIAGAGLDVTEFEPLPVDHALRNLPGVILTPHIAWLSDGARADLQRKAAEEVARVLGGAEPLHPVYA
jgi:D-3-phosphoglycerate dehydrogenase